MNRTSIFAIALFLVFGITGGIFIAYGNTSAGFTFLLLAAMILPLFMFVPKLLAPAGTTPGATAPTSSGWSTFGKIVGALLIIALCFWGISHLLNMRGGNHVIDATNPNQTTEINVERGDVNITNNNTFHNPRTKEVERIIENGSSKVTNPEPIRYRQTTPAPTTFSDGANVLRNSEKVSVEPGSFWDQNCK